jgi:hypothetical protein
MDSPLFHRSMWHVSRFQIPRTHMACAVATPEATSPATQIMVKIIVFWRSTSPAGCVGRGRTRAS